MKWIFTALAILAVAATGISCSAVPRYAVAELPFEAGSLINDSGTIAGYSTVTGGPDAGSSRYYVLQGGTLTSLDTFSVSGLSQDNKLLGRYNDLPYVWSSNVYTALPISGSVPEGAASGINGNGQIVGDCGNLTQPAQAALWENGQVKRLGTLGGTYSWATAINEAGQIIGQGQRADARYHAFLWDGLMQDLGVLPGYTESGANDISSSGVIVGSSTFGSAVYKQHACLWQGLTAPRDLGALAGYKYSLAAAVNDAGQVVGSSFGDTLSQCAATLWQGSGMYDLNSLIDDPTWTLQWAGDINGSGQIVGMGYHNGIARGFVLTQVPEPSGLAALFCGFCCAGTALLRSRRAGTSS